MKLNYYKYIYIPVYSETFNVASNKRKYLRSSYVKRSGIYLALSTYHWPTFWTSELEKIGFVKSKSSSSIYIYII